ncbi:hypothetical protein THTE_3180 [Thermogutta terrifontis]|uniref:Uncharacterized protein n=1 Tax=Thermogutta terrifontis TaxID=1331910 RepID=A0A286RIM1_9BACT|nr:hypothetical protein THTE_3180 [Thermogutta terrifontis]
MQRMARDPIGCGVQFLHSLSAKAKFDGKRQEFITILL